MTPREEEEEPGEEEEEEEEEDEEREGGREGHSRFAPCDRSQRRCAFATGRRGAATVHKKSLDEIMI